MVAEIYGAQLFQEMTEPFKRKRNMFRGVFFGCQIEWRVWKIQYQKYSFVRLTRHDFPGDAYSRSVLQTLCDIFIYIKIFHFSSEAWKTSHSVAH